MRFLLKNSLLLVLFLFPSFAIAQDWSARYQKSFETGNDLVKNFKYDEAIPYLEEAYQLALQHQDDSLTFSAGHKLGSTYFNAGYYDMTIQVSQNIINQLSGFLNPVETAKLQNLIGLGYAHKGEREQAVHEYLKGIEVMKPEQDSSTYALLYRNMAGPNQYLGNYELAIQNSDSSLKYAPKDDLYQISRNYLSKYVSYLWIGKVKEAEPLLLKGLENAKYIDQPRYLTQLYMYAGDYYAKQNDLNKAITFYQKGLEIAIKINRVFDIYDFHYLLGDLFLKLENPDRAITHLNASHQYFESVGNTLQDVEALMLLGAAFIAKKDFDQAEPLLLQAFHTFEELGNKSFKGRAAIKLADLYIAKNEQDKALFYLEEAQKLGAETEVFWLGQDVQERSFLLDEQYVSANEKLRIAHQLYRISFGLEPEEQLRALTILARSYYTSKPDSSFILAEESFKEIEKRRISLSGGMLKAGAFSEFSTFYNEVGSWYAADKEEYGRTFELIEKSKARTLLDQLAEVHNENVSVSEEEEIQLLELQKRIDQLHRQKEQSESLEEKIELDQQISSLQLEYDAMLEQIKADNPAWSTFAYPQVLSLKEVQALLDKKTAVIEYAYTYHGLAILVITERETQFHLVHETGDVRQTLKQQIDDYRSLIIHQASTEDLGAASEELIDVILRPVLPAMDQIKNLVIVPDGELSLLPFDALMVDGRYLAQKYAIKMMPSISVYNLLPRPHRINEDTFYAIAGSGFEAGDGLFGTNAQTAFATLPYTLIEVDSIAAHFEAPKVLKSEQVTEAAIKKQDLSEFKFLHFATHGAINESEPTQSGLILSKKIQMENLFGEDGYLNANEIARLQLNADMVVLSSCNTATGKVLSGEGLLGLQRSFLTAGASSVVASLWSIYDRSTPVFMSHFYHYLIDFEHEELSWYDRLLIKMDWYEPELIDYKTLALQQAKLDMMEHPYYNHPVHWASFVITGK